MFLHNKDKNYLFKLTGDASRLFTDKQLVEKKFSVRKSDETYIGYDPSSPDPTPIENMDIQNAIVRGIDNKIADNYFTTLKRAFSPIVTTESFLNILLWN